MATKKKTTVETDKPAKTVKAVKATAKTTAAKSAAPAKAVKEAKASKTAACNKALKEAAELAPLVQSAKDGTGENTAQKAAEFLMNNYEKNSEEKIIVDGIVIPTQAELLNMPESDYMNERQQAFFKHLLREREAQLRSNAGATAEHLRDNTIIPDMADRATIEEEHALELRTRDRERKLLKKVQEALQRLEKGEYGWCEETGDPIGIPRLLARPTATLSLEAQQRRELRQKLYGN